MRRHLFPPPPPCPAFVQILMKDVVKRVYFAEIWDSHGNLQWQGDTPFDLGEVPAEDLRVGNYDWSSLSAAEQAAFLAASSGFGAVDALEDDALDAPAARADVPAAQWQSVEVEDAMLWRALATEPPQVARRTSPTEARRLPAAAPRKPARRSRRPHSKQEDEN